MGKIAFHNFGFVSKVQNNFTISSSRYAFQKKYEYFILLDIIKKMKINNHDTFLDIGCNVGTQLIPISFLVKNAYGIDHKSCLQKIKKRLPEFNSKNLIHGDYLDLKIKKKFTKILCYSVIQYLDSEYDISIFVLKLLNQLSKGGLVLIGDIPVSDLEIKFYKTVKGQKWTKNFNNENKKTKIRSISDFLKDRPKDDSYIGSINFTILNNIIKSINKKKFIIKKIKHNDNFPFGPTRVDLIIIKKS